MARTGRRFGIAARMGVVVSATAAATVALAALLLLALRLPPAAGLAAALAGGVGAGLGVLLLFLQSAQHAMQALTDGIRGFRDQDFSLRLSARRRDEIGELLALYNEMGDALRAERHDLYQRELLLETVLQGTPIAILLTGPGGRVVYANRAARELLAGGLRLEGRALEEILAAVEPGLREALLAGADALFTTGSEEDGETYRVARRVFHLNMQRHILQIVERLTPELRRREVEVWKRAIRVMNHEMNNSLAPIRSLVHSARAVRDRPEHAHRLDEIFATIEERATHLAAFLEGYAAFARLPRPRCERVSWAGFLEDARRVWSFTVSGAVPDQPGWFDPVQLRQAVINLVKNAHEAGSPESEVRLRVHRRAEGGFALEVADRGRGMDPETAARALLPFYSSKPTGTGLGLALCREILEAHGGGLRLQARDGGGTVAWFWLPGEPERV